MRRVKATDDEQLATELWGDDKEWDDEREQFVPTKKGGDEPSAGNNSSTFSDEQPLTPTTPLGETPSTVRTTEPSSNKETAEVSTAPSTGGNGRETATPANPSDEGLVGPSFDGDDRNDATR